jgi:hypothetical protein
MQAIQSRLYLNVILTVIALFLAVLVFRPYMSFSTRAYAQSRNEQQRERIASTEGAQYDDLAAATMAVADATNEIAMAIREASKSQSDIAKAINKLASQ